MNSIKTFEIKDKLSLFCSYLKRFTVFAAEKIAVASRYIYASYKKSKLLCFSTAALTVFVVTVAFSGITVGYGIEYGDNFIATVKSKSDFESAVSIADTNVKKFEFSDYVYEPHFVFKLTLNRSFASPENVAELLLENTDEIFYGSELFINGKIIACIEGRNTLQGYIDEALHKYDVPNFESTSEFVDVVTTENGYFPKAELTDAYQAKLIIDKLNVITKSNEYTSEPIRYKSVTHKSDERPLGEVKTVVNGVNGEIRHYESVVYYNGVEMVRNENEAVTYKEPIDEITVIGTAPAYVSQGERSNANTVGLIWPLQKVQGWNVSSYFGDGRGHKGVDICSKAGTSIYAAQDGVVEKATSGSGYGNYVIIDHGNGFKTLYAHCSKLYVSKGDEVQQHQVIAAVGSTGNSSGNHLHFEVHINNVAVDPAPYLGLY